MLLGDTNDLTTIGKKHNNNKVILKARLRRPRRKPHLQIDVHLTSSSQYYDHGGCNRYAIATRCHQQESPTFNGLVWCFSSDRSSNSRGVNNGVAAHGKLFFLHLVLLYHLVDFRRDIVNMRNSALAHTLEADTIACRDKGPACIGCYQLSLLDKMAEVRRINFRDLIMVKVSVIFSGISQYLSPGYHGPDGLRGRTSGTLSYQIVSVSETCDDTD